VTLLFPLCSFWLAVPELDGMLYNPHKMFSKAYKAEFPAVLLFPNKRHNPMVSGVGLIQIKHNLNGAVIRTEAVSGPPLAV